MTMHIDLTEAAELCQRSTTWVRNRCKELERQGRASKKTGKWLIEREAILRHNTHKSVPSKKLSPSPVTPHDDRLEAELRAHIAELKEDKKRLLDEVEKLNSENFALRAEVRELLRTDPAKGLKGIVSRWIRT